MRAREPRARPGGRRRSLRFARSFPTLGSLARRVERRDWFGRVRFVCFFHLVAPPTFFVPARPHPNPSDEEMKVVKWGRNASYGNVPTRLRGKNGKGGFATYRNASALECVVGYLYMTDSARLETMMATLGGDGTLEDVADEGGGGEGKKKAPRGS